MAEHRTRVEDSGRGDLPYRWVCVCGGIGKHRWAHPGLAELAGRAHEAAKNAAADHG